MGARSAFVALAFLISGCTAPGAVPMGNPGPVPVSTVTWNEGTASILGLVLDSELVPLPNASIQVRGPSGAPWVVLSDSAGAFEVRGLAAGRYLVLAGALGYRESAPLAVELADGDERRIDVLLERLPTAGPVQKTLAYATVIRGTVCVTAGTTPVCQYVLVQQPNLTKAVPVDEAALGLLQTLIVESRWTPGFAACNMGIRTSVYAPGQGALNENPGPGAGIYHWDNLPGIQSPTYLNIPRDGPDPLAMTSPSREKGNKGPLALSGNWHVQILARAGTGANAPAFQCMIEQRVDAWATAFYGEPARPGWSILVD